MLRRGVGAHLVRGGGHAGHGAAVLLDESQVADDEDFLVPGNGEIRGDLTRPARSTGTPARGRSERRRPGRPDHGAGRDPLLAQPHAVASTPVTNFFVKTTTPRPSSCRCAFSESIGE